ncbi:MAG TPA: V-type ATP synthase subunit E [Thermoanaerobaculia bacterium]
MALDDLLAAVEREAERKIAARLAEAWTESARVAAGSAGHLARRRAEAAAARRAELRATATREVEESRRAARRTVLEARERLLDRVFRAARERLPAAMKGEAYAAALADEVAEVLSYFGAELVVLRCPPALEPQIRKLTSGFSGVTVAADPGLATGLAAESGDGELTVESTLDGRLGRMRPALAIEVLRRAGAAGPPLED